MEGDFWTTVLSVDEGLATCSPCGKTSYCTPLARLSRARNHFDVKGAFHQFEMYFSIPRHADSGFVRPA